MLWVRRQFYEKDNMQLRLRLWWQQGVHDVVISGAEVNETLAAKPLSLGTSALHIHRRAMGPSHVVGVARQGSCRNPRHCESGAALRSEAGGNGDIETALHSGIAHPRGGPGSNKDWRGMECTPSLAVVILVTDGGSIMVSKAQGCSKAILHSAVAPLTARSTVADGVGALARGGRTLAERWQHACNTRQHAMHYVLRAPKKATFVAEKTGGVRQRQRAPLQAGAHRCRTRFGLRSSECIVYDGAWGDGPYGGAPHAGCDTREDMEAVMARWQAGSRVWALLGRMAAARWRDV